MQELTGATERRTTVILALLVLAVMLLPAGVGAQEDAPQPMSRLAAPAAEPSAEPTAEPTEEPGPVEAIGQDVEVPVVPAASEAPTPVPASEEPVSEEPAAVEAEGNEAEEVAAPPAAPQPEPRADEAAPPAEEPPAEPAADAPVAPDAAAYGPQIVPSLGTATQPLTNEMAAFDGAAPLVLAPEIAGQQIQPNGPLGAAPVTSGLLSVVEPVQDVAAATLSIVQPSWFATTFAMLILLAAASYGAVLRVRGEDVPEAIAFASAIRPRDADARVARSIRPADLTTRGARSIRP